MHYSLCLSLYRKRRFFKADTQRHVPVHVNQTRTQVTTLAVNHLVELAVGCAGRNKLVNLIAEDLWPLLVR